MLWRIILLEDISALSDQVQAKDLVARPCRLASRISGDIALPAPNKRGRDDTKPSEQEFEQRHGGCYVVSKIAQKKQRVDSAVSGSCEEGVSAELADPAESQEDAPLLLRYPADEESAVDPPLPTGTLIIGIREMWVCDDHRRQGIATTLLDKVRATYQFRAMVPRRDVAFSQPTSSGEAFAFKYCCGQPFVWTYSLSSI